MAILLGIVLAAAGIIIIFFKIPYSPVKQDFLRKVGRMIQSNYMDTAGEVFTEKEFSSMPAAVQKYMAYCGYIGRAKMSYMKMEFKDADLVQGRGGRKLCIDYTQFNFVKQPDRCVLIDSSVYGVPFEGCDSFIDGKGGMKGTIGKAVTLFNQRGREMDAACLVTFLAECFLFPNALLQDYITLEEIDAEHVKAVISYDDLGAEGIFTFNEAGGMTVFTTENRGLTHPDGTMEQVKWSAVCGGYREGRDGIRHPDSLQAVWNFEDNDFIYFDGKVSSIEYH